MRFWTGDLTLDWLGVRETEGMPVFGVGVEFTSDTVVDRISGSPKDGSSDP